MDRLFDEAVPYYVLELITCGKEERMRKGLIAFCIFVVAVLFLMNACGRLQNPVAAEGAGETVGMTASDFKFQPNNITTRAGSTLTFRIRNVSGTTHNFTLKSPDGKTIRSVDIPAKETVEVKAAFMQPGTYKFDCNKPGHSELGMKGQVVAAAR